MLTVSVFSDIEVNIQSNVPKVKNIHFHSTDEAF